MKSNIKIVLTFIVTLLLLIYLAGFLPVFSQDGVITGRIMVPGPETTEDVQSWIPVTDAIVSLTDTVGDIHSVSTDEKGYYFFNNLAVNANCVITANAVVNGKTMVFKDIIPHPVAANETYDAGTADAKSTALALIVEGLMDQGLTSGNINLETIQGSDNFVTVFNQVSIVLEDNSNVMDEIIVTGEGVSSDDGSTAYNVTVIRAPSSNADLSSLSVSEGTLNLVFDYADTSYTVAVANYISSITFTPTAADSLATITVDEAEVLSGGTSASIILGVGANTIDIVVTAEDETTKTYTVTVIRALSSNADLSSLSIDEGTPDLDFSSNTTTYEVAVVNSVDNITFTPTAADDTATINIDGTPVPSGVPSVPVNLDIRDNSIFIEVTAEDKTTNTYTITVNRNILKDIADLCDLTLSVGTLDPIFDSNTISYKVAVGHSVESITFTPVTIDAAASVKVDGTTVENGELPAPVSLDIGDNIIPTVVTAEDGVSTKTYMVNVNRLTTPTLTVAVDGSGSGTVRPAAGKHTYNYGDKVNLNSKAGKDSDFICWLQNENIDNITKANTRVTMNGDQTVTAIFNLTSDTHTPTMETGGTGTGTFTSTTHTLIMATDGTGTGTVTTNPDKATYNHGDKVNIKAKASADSVFTNWLTNENIDDTAKANTRVTMNDDQTVTAIFTLMVTAGKLHHIVISPADPAAIKTGETQTYTAEAFDADNISLGDVTSDTKFTIEKGAKGKWDKKNKNVYTSEKAGTWEVTGEYSKKIKDTATLTVAEVLPVIGGTVIITGDAKNGVTLEISGIIYTPSTEDDEPTYQWKRGGGAISGATSNTYTLVEADIGKKITVIVTADGIHATGNVTSAETAAVEKADGVVPAAPLELEGTKTATSITLTANVLHQFSKDDGVTWQDSNLFEELNPGTEYTFKAKAIETATHKESAASTGTAITTLVLTYYTLTIVADPVAGGTATDVPAAGPYAAGTVVNISAVANGGYEFDGWTAAPAVTFGDASTAVTTFTMSAQNVNVTANLVCKPLDKIDKINIDTDKPFLGTCATINSVTIKYEDGSNDEITPSYIGKGLSWSYDSTKISFDPATGKVCRTDGVVGTEYKITFTYTDACVESKTKEVKVKFEATLDKIEINIDTKEPCSDSCANINSVTIKYKDGSNNDEIIPSYSDTGLSWSYDSNNKIRFDPATGKVCLTDGVVGTEYKITFTYTTSTDDCVESVTKEVKVKFETCNP